MATFSLESLGTAPKPQTARAILWLLLLTALFELLRTAWMSDDGLITVRCILNAVHGYGPSFNIDERVQPFSHPLWFLLSLLVTHLVKTPWFAMLLISVLCSASTLYLIYARIGAYRWTALLAAAVLLLSKPYVDYSTSGLETPLSNVLILLTAGFGVRRLTLSGARGTLGCFMSLGLLYLNRADLALLVGPLVLLVACTAVREREPLMASLALAAIPVLAWSAFSLVYYGFLVPNTAFAKLGGGIAFADRCHQGMLYLFDSACHDPLTLPAIVVGVAIGVRAGRALAVLAVGIVLYLSYVVMIGGDQMSGRFLVAPLLTAMIILVHSVPGSLGPQVARAVFFMLLGCLGLPQTLMADPDMASSSVRDTGIADERGVFFRVYGLPYITRDKLQPWPWRKHLKAPQAVRFIDCGGLGTVGLQLGPETHVGDRCGLADALMARLPATRTEDWRISHVLRDMPAGYQQSILANANLIEDPKIAALYDALRIVTRGPLFTRERWADIVRLNLGMALPPVKTNASSGG